jgi:hypothetical protein
MEGWSRDSSVGIATGYRLNDRGIGVLFPIGARFFSSLRRPDWFWGTPNLLSNVVTGALSLGVKRPRRESDQSPPTTVGI